MQGTGKFRVRFMRYIDWIAYLSHVGVLDNIHTRAEWEQEFFQSYDYDLHEIKQGDRVVAIDTGSTSWVEFYSTAWQDDLRQLEDFAGCEIRPTHFLCDRGTPGRSLEELDWPPFYGFVQPYKGDPVAFTSAAHAPSFLTIPATSDGSPARTVSNTEAHETFLRTRLAVEELMADADRHLRFQGQCLPGPASFEELESERRWEWFEDTEEEERRRRASNLGSRRAPKPRPDRDATLVEPEVVSAVVFSTESHDTEGRVIDRKASSDQEFQSVFANHLRARRVARK